MGEIFAPPAPSMLQLPQAELAPSQGQPCRDSPISCPLAVLADQKPERVGPWKHNTVPHRLRCPYVWAAEVERYLWRDAAAETSKGPQGQDLLESISRTVRPHHPLENEIRANIFLCPPDKSTELPGI